MVQITKFQDDPLTLKKATHIVNFSILTAEQTNYVQRIDTAPAKHLLDNNHENAILYVNTSLKTSKSDISFKTFWYPTPESPGNPNDHTRIQKRTLLE